MKVLWSINVYSRAADARILAGQVKERFGDDAYVLVVCSHETLSEEEFRSPHIDKWAWIPNTGHHNGVRDALNRTALEVGLSSHRYGAVVCSHADNLWSSMEPVERALGFLASAHDGVRDADAVAISGGPRGAMDSDNPDWFGYFMDWIAFTPACLLSMCPIRRACDGERWVECVVADALRESGARVHELPCRSVDRLHTNMFVDIMDNPEWWMSADHDLDRKLRLLPPHVALRIRQENGL